MTIFTTFERLKAHIQGLEGMRFRFKGDEKNSPGRYLVLKVDKQNIVAKRLDPHPGEPMTSRDWLICYFAKTDPIAIEAVTQEVAP